MATLNIAGTLLPWMAVALSGCAHACPTHEPPDSSWAEGVACHHHVELDEQVPADRLGCYRLAIGPTYLLNRSTRGKPSFIPNPEIIELTSEWFTKERINSGFLVQTPVGSTPWGDNGVWRPTRAGGALIDLGTGFSGLLLVMHRNGWGYTGDASTYQDLGDDSAIARADLWPVSCTKMPSNGAPNLKGAAN